MNTATTKPFTLRGNPMLRRFLWKEFRMIRGLWLAVALIGLILQVFAWLLMSQTSGSSTADMQTAMFVVALGCGVLYTVGAAATSFSVEHEEETYDFLLQLPVDWRALFAGKVLIAYVSAVLLTIALLFTAILMQWSRPADGNALAVPLHFLRVAIPEALAWGILFSLLIRRPLLAAIVTLIAGALATTMAVNFASNDSLASLNPNAYETASRLRMWIVIAVLIAAGFVARRWLVVGAHPLVAGHLQSGSRFGAFLKKLDVWTRFYPRTAAYSSPPGRMLPRLLWQTWRASWKLLCAPVGAALLLLVGVHTVLIFSLPVLNNLANGFGLGRADQELASFAFAGALLFTPTIYGVLAFYLDQRRGSYRFLAEHAARARYVWLARHLVWLGVVILSWLLLVVGLAILAWNTRSWNSRYIIQSYIEFDAIPNAATTLYDFVSGADTFSRMFAAGSIAGLVVYGIGQFFSMAVRSEILAGFLSLILAFFVGAWTLAVCLWHLPPWLLMFPIFVGLMLATWLRAPDWIAGRNSWRGWWLPALAIAATLLFVALLLPTIRLAQMNSAVERRVWNSAAWYYAPIFLALLALLWFFTPSISLGRTRLRSIVLTIAAPVFIAALFLVARSPETLSPRDQERANNAKAQAALFVDQLAAFRAADSTEAARTADMYAQVSAQLRDDLSKDLLKPWRKEEYLSNTETLLIDQNVGDEIDEKKLSADQLPAFNKARQDQREWTEQAYQRAIDKAIEISKRPTCRFHVDPATIPLAHRGRFRQRVMNDVPVAEFSTYQYVNSLLYDLIGMSMHNKLPLSVDNFEAALRMLRHLRSGQPSAVVVEEFWQERMVLGQINRWAFDRHRTKVELADALDRLSSKLLTVDPPTEALFADHVQILDVINGSAPPSVMEATSKADLKNPKMSPQMYLAYIANQLPWERRRAVLALDKITRFNLSDLRDITRYLEQPGPFEYGGRELHQFLRSPYSDLPERWQINNPAAVTSYLTSLEYDARVPITQLNQSFCDLITYRRATVLQIALAAYRLDHDEFPERLSDLVPEYLESLPFDPYSRQPFQYEPLGLGLPLDHPFSYAQYEQSEPVAVDQPFLWSVGPGNVRLQLLQRTRNDPAHEGATPPGEDIPQITYNYYRFVDAEWPYDGSTNAVFPLPK